MNTQENTEKVLRQLYLLLARGEVQDNNPDKIIVSKKQAERLLNELNKCIYDMLETYEMTSQSRDKAERGVRRQSEKIITEAQNRAEDVYAASIIYSEDSLNRISAIMRESSVTMEKLYAEMSEKLREEEKTIRKNQSELRSQLQTLKDTDRYLEKMTEWREEEEREKRRDTGMRTKEPNMYANRRTEVKVNREFLKKMNLEPVAEIEDDDVLQPAEEKKGETEQNHKIGQAETTAHTNNEKLDDTDQKERKDSSGRKNRRGKHGRNNREDNREKVNQTEKPSKADQAEKAGQTEKADQTAKADRTEKTDRTEEADRTEKTDCSEKNAGIERSGKGNLTGTEEIAQIQENRSREEHEGANESK